MRKIMLISALVILSGCGAVRFNIKEKPIASTSQQTQLDDLQCSNLSHVNGPWLFGIGTLIYRSMSADRYRDCMNGKGYKVDEA